MFGNNKQDRINKNKLNTKNTRGIGRFFSGIIAAIAALSVAVSPLPVAASQYSDGSTYYGIDVSEWNGNIDWSQVASAGYSFAFIRGGAGYDYTDTKFHENMQAAADAGIARGVYYYSMATDTSRAVADADHLINLVQGYDVELPLVIDIEDDCQLGLGRDELTAIVKAFCDEISAYGYTPMIYVSESWALTKINLEELEGVPRWIAAWSAYMDSTERHIWQSSNTGSVSGISGDVDIDISFVDPRSLKGSAGYVSVSGYSAGWYEDSAGDWYLYGENNTQLTGWQKSGGSWYYLQEDGRMATGWIESGGKWYYLQDSGVLTSSGWQHIGENWYLFNEDGAMQTGWQQLAGNWYYLENGVMTTGWKELDQNWYYFDESGVMVTGNREIGGDYYYFSDNGVMQNMQE